MMMLAKCLGIMRANSLKIFYMSEYAVRMGDNTRHGGKVILGCPLF